VLATLEREHNKYLDNQPIWNQYIVCTYTLGSQPVNRRLVGLPVDSKFAHKWTFELFNNFTYGIQHVPKQIPAMDKILCKSQIIFKIVQRTKEQYNRKNT
jgi:hypothetical protein